MKRKTRIEQLNEILYTSREKVINILDWGQVVSLWVAFVVLIYVMGFELEGDEVSKIFRWLEGLIGLFVVDYAVRLLYAFDKKSYVFEEKRLESMLAGGFLLTSLGQLLGLEFFYWIFLAIGYEDYRFFYEAFVVMYLFILIITGVARASRYLDRVGISPATTFIFSFVILIFGGAGFLMLPAMTTIQGSMRFIDAVFTSASAACVTGLAVQDTASFFTVKGQIVILVIIQLGGIGIVSFATFFATFLSQGVGLKQQAIIQDMLSTESLGDAKKTLRQVIFLTFLIEGIGAICLFFAWSPDVQYHTPIPQKELLTEIALNKSIDREVFYFNTKKKPTEETKKATEKTENKSPETIVKKDSTAKKTAEVEILEAVETAPDSTAQAQAPPSNKRLNNSLSNKIWYSIFHSISAFCNAGFSLFSNGLNEDVVNRCFVIHLIIAFIIIFGSLGYTTIVDVFSPANIRERVKTPWKQWNLNTQIAMNLTLVLCLIGAVFYFFLEQKHTLEGKNLFEQIVASFFQSVTTRTAGFNTVPLNLASISTATYLLIIFLMFVGAASGSTGGGIKTSTFFLLVHSAIASITSKKNVEISKRTIPNDVISRAFSIVAFALAFNAICIFLLTIVQDNMDIRQLFFEQISAFATVGLSLETTPLLNDYSKAILILTMYVGRVGTLTLAFALSKKVVSTSYRYPSAHVTVG